MQSKLVTATKNLLRPIAKPRFLIERAKYFGSPIAEAQAGNDILHAALTARRAMAAGKMGETELGGLLRWLSIQGGSRSGWGKYAGRLYTNAGVYPASPQIFERFCALYSASLAQLDLLGVWFRHGENSIRKRYAPQAQPTRSRALEPYYHARPWSEALAGKRVLVITPFADTVRQQYGRREAIWPSNPQLLPAFSLDTLRCPLSAGITQPQFADWFVALEAMQAEMARRDFEVVLVGAGAWGLPLVAHAKRLGRSGIHLGGATQILFGIRGARWDAHPAFQHWFNEAWVRPGAADRPEKLHAVENGCYW